MSNTLTNRVRKVLATVLLAGLGIGASAGGPAQAGNVSPATKKAPEVTAQASHAITEATAADSVAEKAAGTTGPASRRIVETVKAVAQRSNATRAAAPTGTQRPRGNWTWWGYRFTRAETAVIASISLWNAVSGAKGTRFAPSAAASVAIYACAWVLAAETAQQMGQCLGISHSGTGMCVHCTA